MQIIKIEQNRNVQNLLKTAVIMYRCQKWVIKLAEKKHAEVRIPVTTTNERVVKKLVKAEDTGAVNYKIFWKHLFWIKVKRLPYVIIKFTMTGNDNDNDMLSYSLTVWCAFLQKNYMIFFPGFS